MFPTLKDVELEELPYRRMYQTVQAEFPELDEDDWRTLARLRVVARAQREKTLRQVQLTIRELLEWEPPKYGLLKLRALVEQAMAETVNTVVRELPGAPKEEEKREDDSDQSDPNDSILDP